MNISLIFQQYLFSKGKIGIILVLYLCPYGAGTAAAEVALLGFRVT
jgi:hypothetical protein